MYLHQWRNINLIKGQHKKLPSVKLTAEMFLYFFVCLLDGKQFIFLIWVIFVLDDGIEFMTLFVTKTNRVIDYNNVFSFINLNLEKTNK